MKPDGLPGIDLGTEKENSGNSPVDHVKSCVTNIWGLVPKPGELPHRLVKQRPHIVMLMESYLTDNVPDTNINILDISCLTGRTDWAEMVAQWYTVRRELPWESSTLTLDPM
eukprot:g30041.t1